jgi:phosphatidylethanolamine/phosphatidyl-N-methylethanolamine N-methyltransferase
MDTWHPALSASGSKPGSPGYRLRMVAAWLLHPIQTAAAAPSGPSLARLMTKDIGFGTGPVLELGAGSGSLTTVVLNQGVAEDQLTLVEKSHHLAQLLRDRFPRANVIKADATALSPATFSNSPLFGAAISSIGLSSMHPRSLRTMLRTTFSCLRPDASLYQCSYGFGPPVSKPLLNRMGLRAERIGAAWKNVPPAAVYRISRLTKTKRLSDASSLFVKDRLPS